ncbi:MAG: orotate phosphoribosyltransferase [Elusimicrobiota bacterium]|nr:orotate phosphoribosyltransferase [Endomicrobiia bacterium]MCX7910392.1 orotate phosphoribosyltransferase [Endomicrobiia bacterium]MDW8165071.1 orotate phosphoribosyltransferase [Elusimicrobiota bacterium]
MDTKENYVIEILKTHNAILEGHFLLSSGLHSDKYIQCALVLQYPEIAERIAELLFEEIRNNFSMWEDINLVISPALGGIIIGQEVARVIGRNNNKKIRAIFTERTDDGKMTLRRGFDITYSDNILIVEDVVTTGRSTQEVIDVVKERNGNILALSSIINRTENENDLNFKYPYFYLMKLKINNYDPKICPLCKQGIKLVKPGSRKNF